MIADGSTSVHIVSTQNKIVRLCGETGIDSLAGIRRETVERWIAGEVQKKEIAPSTINTYLKSMKSFAQYLTDIELLPNNPLKPIRKLNETIEQRKKRRAMTAEEIKRLLQVTAQSEANERWQVGERVLIYQLLLGTGLRSTELSLLTPGQIDFDRHRLRIEAAKTKNKKADVLPIREDLVQYVKEWVMLHGIQSHERIFRYTCHSLCYRFYTDLKAAGIERLGADGRSIDVHSLRKTFGTMLARAGVPLTTTQRLMRHSTPVLTAQLYIDVDPVDMMQALGQLEVFSVIPSKSHKVSSNDSLCKSRS
jgi:integrase